MSVVERGSGSGGGGSRGESFKGVIPDVEPEEFPRKFGPFTLLGVLGRGGMGEVYVAQREGFAGIAKRCVVKTLRPGFSDDREYVTRFLDEARIVVQLHHKNICPVYDVGKVGARHYLAMEYIAGRDLRLVAARAQQASRSDPGLALFIVSEMLEALDYAHRLVDPVNNEPLLLVHRDVSPHNVMVGFEGDVRLIDFGLAASTLKLEQTAPNVVMGKVAYMAPEHVCGEHLDGRADQFSAAVTAYELFVGERFYEEREAREVYQLAANGGFRPATFKDLPSDLRAALDKALAADRNDRFASCGEFREAIEAFRFKRGFRGDAPALRMLMHAVFPDELLIERSVFSKAGSSSAPVAHPAGLLADASSPSRTPEVTTSSPSSSSSSSSSSPWAREVPADETNATTSSPSARVFRDAPEKPAVDPHATVLVERSSREPAKPSRSLVYAAAATGVVVVAAFAVIGIRLSTLTPDAVPQRTSAPPAAAVSPAAPPNTPTTAPTTPTTTTTAPTTTAPTTTAPTTPAAEALPIVEILKDTREARKERRLERKVERELKGAPPTSTAPVSTVAAPATPATPAPAASVRPPGDAPVGVRIDFLAGNCAQLGCTSMLKAHRADWGTLTGGELKTFLADLKACYAQCRP